MTIDREKKILFFGVFDGLHNGHRYFINQCRKLGGFLIAVVTPDQAVKKLKGRPSKQNQEARIKSLGESGLVDEIILGDKKLNSWDILKNTKPQVVAVGYDQKKLKQALEKVQEKYNFKIVQVDGLKPETYSSSLLNGKT